MIMGKTHLHQLAYGITGENKNMATACSRAIRSSSPADRRAGVQPVCRRARRLPPSAPIPAVPSRAGGALRFGWLPLDSRTRRRGSLEGRLAPGCFVDTLGWLFRDLRDGPVLAAALLGVKPVAAPKDVIVAAVAGPYLDDCEPAVRDMYNARQEVLRSGGAQIEAFAPDFWANAREIFGGIQAHEAAAIHRGNFEHFEKTIADRLAWGASLSAATIEDLRKQHVAFRAHMDRLLEQ